MNEALESKNESVDKPAEISWSAGAVIGERYRLESILAQGQAVSVWRGRDLQAAAAEPVEVVLKHLGFAKMADWKQLQLLEREARLLAQLSHPRLPRCLDLLEFANHDVCLIETALPGENLSQRLAHWLPTEAEVIRIASQALSLLGYLHTLQPPVIHRDIKPSNLLLDDAGRLYLIDFGAITQGASGDAGTTVVGTLGYMAPEQWAGRALPGSDLYALGLSLIRLLSGAEPDHLPIHDGFFHFRGLITCSAALAHWLELMVHPNADLRFQTAAEALLALPGAQALDPSEHPPLTEPAALASPATLANAVLGLKSSDAMHPADQARDLANYRLRQCLKRNGGVSTWLGANSDGEQVIVKVLALSELGSIKQLELFEREIEALQGLKHERIPRLLDRIKTTTEQALVLEYLPGETLQQLLNRGWRLQEAEVWELAHELLEILQALHGHGLIHRDLKPSNLLRHSNQSLYLLDFGAVQELFRLSGSGGSTVVGSFGYMAPEQFLGRACPQSDLYALGMCLLQLLTGRHPAELAWDGARVQLTGLAISPQLARWLGGLVETDLARRIPSAAQALQGLRQWQAARQNEQLLQRQSTPQLRQQRQSELETKEETFFQATRFEQKADAWSGRLAQQGLPAPPQDLKVVDSANELLLRLPLPENQTRLGQLLTIASMLSQMAPMTKILCLVINASWGFLAMVDMSTNPSSAMAALTAMLVIDTIGLIVYGYVYWLRYLTEKDWLQEPELRLTDQELLLKRRHFLSSAVRRRVHLPESRVELSLPRSELKAVTLKRSPPRWPLQGPLYQLVLQSRQGEELISAPCSLSEPAKAWLDRALPLITADSQSGSGHRQPAQEHPQSGTEAH